MSLDILIVVVVVLLIVSMFVLIYISEGDDR